MDFLVITSIVVVVCVDQASTPQQKGFLPSIGLLNTFKIFYSILKQNTKFQPELKLQKSFPKLVLMSCNDLA